MLSEIWLYIVEGQKGYHKIVRCDVRMSKTPLGVGLNLELMLILRIYLVTVGWEVHITSQLYILALAWMGER